MGQVVARLLDEHEQFVKTVVVESDQTYALNDHFGLPDGSAYVICVVKPGQPPIATELTAIWVDGPHPGGADYFAKPS
jgi:hypothetical protein